MFNYIWPMVLIVVSNTIYNICTKSMPSDMDPLASLTVTYAVGAVVCLVLYFFLNKDASLAREYSRISWAPIVLGIVIVGLEAGYIYAYKAGWSVSTAPIVQAAVLAVILVIVGYVMFKESITAGKVAGILICLVGLYLINRA